MRIAYVCTDSGVPIFGTKGCSIHAQEILRAFVQRGADVELLTTRVGGEPAGDLASVRVRRLARGASESTEERERSSLDLNATVRRELASAGPFDLVYERYSLWSDGAMQFAREAQIPGIVEVNAPLIEEQSQYRTLLNRAAAERATQSCFDAAQTIVAVSDSVAAYAQRHGAADRKIHVIPNGVDCRRFSPACPPALPELARQFTVGFVGTLRPWHGVEFLFEAFARLAAVEPRARLLIVGDGPLREELRESAWRWIPNAQNLIHWTGAVDASEVPGLLTSMSVAVAPYPDLEDFYFSPLKLYEYMAAGRAVVASRLGQIDSLIRDGHNGLLYRPGNVDALDDALLCLSRDSELVQRLGREARATVAGRLSWRCVLEKILSAARFETTTCLAEVASE
ncbi:MAG: glycosyltransferase family 4 protein [Planctomycetales bacterium]|nr:glycosyltransferase family 4 protein [Planctomycetales bacterium]